MQPKKTSPREEYRQQERRRAEASPTLAKTFKELKSLSVDLTHVDSERLTNPRKIKFTFNLEHAGSVFRFDCSNPDCVGGDFDLTEELKQAVMDQEDTADGEMVCQGWRNANTIDRVRCLNVLRYRLTLGY